MKVLLVSPGQTDWTEQHRVKGNLDVPLNASGVAEVEKLARRLRSDGIDTIYCPTTIDGAQTARIIARIIRAKVYPRRELNELDHGLWQGLTVRELKHRHPHVYARWLNSPSSIRPPRGEDLVMAFGRVSTVLKELKRSRTDRTVVCVAASVIRRVLVCHLSGKQVDQVTALNRKEDEVQVIEL